MSAETPPVVFLIHWHAAEASARAAQLIAAGWRVEVESEDGARAIKSIRRARPAAVLIYLDRLPSHGRETGRHFRQQPWSSDTPLLFAGGRPDKVAQVRQAVAQAEFVDIGQEVAAIRSALATSKADS